MDRHREAEKQVLNHLQDYNEKYRGIFAMYNEYDLAVDEYGREKSNMISHNGKVFDETMMNNTTPSSLQSNNSLENGSSIGSAAVDDFRASMHHSFRKSSSGLYF